MKKLFTLLLIALLGTALLPMTVQASHMAGVDITYTYTGTPGQWIVRLKYYNDCLGINAPGQVTICYSSASTGLSGTVIAPQIGMTPVPNTPCVTAAATCNSGVGDIEEYIYETIVNLPAPAVDWVFSWADCCRNGAITTLQPNGMYVSANLNSVVAPTNSSPTFSNLAYTRFCVGNQFFYDQGATDIDGDSLVFSLVTAEDGNFGACPNNPFPNTYIAPFTPQNFCSSSIPITINSTTGVINFVPSQVQVAVMCVLVREYRNGVLIGQVKRDIQIKIVAQCNQILPSFNNNILNSTGGQLFAGCNDRQVIIPFDTTFQCGSAVPTDLRVLSPFGIPNPAISVQPINCTNGESDSLLVTFLNPLTVGSTYVWIKRGQDGNTLLSQCGSEIPEFQDTVNIVVVDNSVWSPAVDSVGCIFNDFTITLTDSVYCFSIANDGSDVSLVDPNGSIYPIANVFGYCSPGGLKTNQLLVTMSSPTSAAGPLYLILNNAGGTDGNTLANNCGRFLSATDTLAILYIDNIIPINLGSDQSICSFDPFPNLDCGFANITYQWYDANGSIAGATQQTYTPTAAGAYSVIASVGSGCSGSDTIVINVIPAAVDNLGNDLILCISDTIPTFDAGNSGATYQWYLNGTAISGANAQTYTPSIQSPGNYTITVEINTGLVQCIGSFDVILQIDNFLPLALGSDQILCSFDPIPTLDCGYPNASYQWYSSNGPISGATSQTYTPTAGDEYWVIATGASGCTGSDTISITVIPLAVDNLGGDLSLCVSDTIPTLDAGNAGSTYQWLLNGVAIAGETNQTYSPNSLGTGTFTVAVVVDPGNAACADTFDVNLQIDNTITFSLGSDLTLCSSDPFPTLDCGILNNSYQWYTANGPITGATSQTYSPSAPGEYSVLVTGPSGCTGSDTVNLTVIPLAVDNLGNDLSLCVSDTIPTLDAGNTGSTFQWLLNGVAIAGETNQTYSPNSLGTGTFTVAVVVDPGNAVCADTFDVILQIDNTITFSLGSDLTLCSSDTLPTLDCGVLNNSYQWYSSSGLIAGATAQTYSPNTAGEYSVLVTGPSGCTGSDTVNINVIPALVDNLGSDITLCTGDALPQYDAGNNGSTYQWSIDGSSVAGETNQTFTPYSLVAGSYTIGVVINPGLAACIDSFTVGLQIIDYPILALADQYVCSDQSALLDATSTNATSYAWSTGENTPIISPTTSGIYTITVSNSNCSTTDSVSLFFKSYPVAPVVACNPGGSSTFKYLFVWSYVDGNDGYEVSFDDGLTWVSANVPTGPESHGTDIPTSSFRVRAIVDTANNNSWCGPGRISDPAPCEVRIPNIFTPNGDGKNDFFKIDNIDQYPNNTVQIFNRWGKEVYNVTDYNNDSKKFEGKDLPDGVYYYIVDLGNGDSPFTGTVNIHR